MALKSWFERHNVKIEVKLADTSQRPALLGNKVMPSLISPDSASVKSEVKPESKTTGD